MPKKLTRAAIFASTALAAPACWTGKTAPTETTPVDNKHEERGSGNGSSSGSDTHVTEVPDPNAGRGTIVITVVDGNSGNTPVPGRWVRLVGGQSPANQQVTTDARGIATFANVPPGSYKIEAHDGHPRHSPTVINVTVKAGETAQSTMAVYVQQYNPNQIPMPYGAPPVRRRVV